MSEFCFWLAIASTIWAIVMWVLWKVFNIKLNKDESLDYQAFKSNQSCINTVLVMAIVFSVIAFMAFATFAATIFSNMKTN